MALKLCTLNCKGFKLCKVKHIESLLATCDILLLQETWWVPDQVGKPNMYFLRAQYLRSSGIIDNKVGRKCNISNADNSSVPTLKVVTRIIAFRASSQLTSN